MPEKLLSHGQRLAQARRAQRKAEEQMYERRASRRADQRFYKSARWRKLRARVLSRQPLCERCEAAGYAVPATEVHHIRARQESATGQMDEANLMALCKGCHARIENEERGEGGENRCEA